MESIRLGGPAHGIVTKTVHIALPGGGRGAGGGRLESMESIRLGGPAHGIVTKTVHITLPGGVGGVGVPGWVGVVGSRGVGVVGVQGWVGRRWWGSRGGWIGV